MHKVKAIVGFDRGIFNIRVAKKPNPTIKKSQILKAIGSPYLKLEDDYTGAFTFTYDSYPPDFAYDDSIQPEEHGHFNEWLRIPADKLSNKTLKEWTDIGKEFVRRVEALGESELELIIHRGKIS
jgi:hypothetical protein